MVQPGEVVTNVPCSSVYHSTTCSSDILLTCGCELGQWVDCEDTVVVDVLPKTGEQQTNDAATIDTRTGETAKVTDDAATCRHANEDFAPGRVVAYMDEAGMFQRCTCGSSQPGAWDCTALTSLTCDPLDSLAVLQQQVVVNIGTQQPCECVRGKWQCPTAASGSSDKGLVSTTTTGETSGEAITDTTTGESQEVADDVATCRHANEDFSPGRIVAYMDEDGMFQRCTCGSLQPGEWNCMALTSLSCDPLESLAVLQQHLVQNIGMQQTCECILGQWQCPGTASGSSVTGVTTRGGESGECIPGAQREHTTCNNEGCNTERCVCSAEGQYLCNPYGSTDRNPTGGLDTSGSIFGTCNFRGFQVPVGFEFETSHEVCRCTTAGGEMDCELKQTKAPCEFMGIPLPDGATRGSSHTGPDGVTTSESCLCNDGAWDCHSDVGPRR